MLQNKFLPLLFLISATAMAAPDVYILDENIPKQPFEKAGAKVKDVGSSEGTSLPTVELTDKLLSDSGFGELVKSWDQLDKDMLILTLKYLPPAEAAKVYPKLDRAKLARLKASIH